MRADLLALTPEAVTALANLGLVKRAQREIASGLGPALAEDAEGIVTGRFPEGTVTTLPPNVALRAASCSCGAATICRHRVAVALAYADLRGAGRAREAWSPGEVDDDALEALVGKNAYARARVVRRRGIVAELEGETLPVARLPTCTVRFHVPHDLAYARCDCRLGVACEHIVVAAWAFREADRRPQPPGPMRTVALGGGEDEALAPSAIALVEHVLEAGIAHVGAAAQPRFARARADLGEQAWPGALVDELERLVEAYRARSARYRTSDAVFALVSIAARARASARSDAALPARFVLGRDEAKETTLDHVRLVSLGARVEADGDSRIASVFLAEPVTGAVLVVARTFENGDALAARRVTGRITLGALAHGQLVTRAARRQANQSLTLSSRTARTAVTPSTGASWNDLGPGLLVEDRGALAAELATRPPRVLRPVTLAARTKVLAVGSVESLTYRPADQAIVARVRLRTSGTMLVTRRHGRAAPAALDALAAAFRQRPRFISGDLRIGEEGLELDPLALVVEDRIVVPDLAPAPVRGERLPTEAPSEARPLTRALAITIAVLEEALHDGLSRLRAGFGERLAAAAAALGDAGLEGARTRLQAFGDARSAATWLEAALRVELTREAMLLSATGAG